MSSICFIMPFFAPESWFSLKQPKFPNYFQYFTETFSKNKVVDLKIFTNIPYQEYEKPDSNIQFYPMKLQELVRLLRTKLNLKLRKFNPYKICDLRPAFGHIFEDYLREYDFWGYCDCDMIMGDLGKFFTPENLQGYDLVVATVGIPGYMIAYRNNDTMKFLFQKSPDHRMVFEDLKNYRFDENGTSGIIALEQLVRQENIKVNNLKNFVHNDGGGLNRGRKWLYQWNNGILIDCLTQEEIGSLHLMKYKHKPEFVIEPFQPNLSFNIDATGIHFQCC